MGVALQHAARVTRAEYDRMIARGLLRDQHVELIHGAILPMAPIGPPHCHAVTILTELLIEKLQRRATLRVQLPFAAHDDSEPEPDVAIVLRGDYLSDHPRRAFLLIEVAESSLTFDRETKGPLYAASNVDEYWIVDVAARAIEAHTVPKDGRFMSVARVEMGGSLAIAAFPGVEIAVAALFLA